MATSLKVKAMMKVAKAKTYEDLPDYSDETLKMKRAALTALLKVPEEQRASVCDAAESISD